MEAENSTLTPEYLNDFKVMTDEVCDLEQSDSMSITLKTITGQGWCNEKRFEIVSKSNKKIEIGYQYCNCFVEEQ